MQFSRGQARVLSGAGDRDRVYEEMHPIERQFDPEKTESRLSWIWTRVTVVTSEGKRVMERD